MKNKKKISALVILTAFALVFSSCAFKLDSAQQLQYDGFIKGLVTMTTAMDVDAPGVKAAVDSFNNNPIFTFRIEDKTPDQPIKQGTKADTLKKRFVPKKK